MATIQVEKVWVSPDGLFYAKFTSFDSKEIHTVHWEARCNWDAPGNLEGEITYGHMSQAEKDARVRWLVGNWMDEGRKRASR